MHGITATDVLRTLAQFNAIGISISNGEPTRRHASYRVGAFGAYLAMMSPIQEDRLLEGKLVPCSYWRNTDDSGCLCGLAENMMPYGHPDRRPVMDTGDVVRISRDLELTMKRSSNAKVYAVGIAFESAVAKFGIERVANALRGRILRNKLRRELKNVSQAASVRV